MANKDEAKIKFIAETSEFTEQINRANQSLTELRSELKLSEAQFKDNEHSVEALADKKRILQEQLAASADKVEALRQKLERAKSIYGENSTEVSKLKTQLNNAERQYVDTENAINDVNKELDKQQTESKQSSDATDELADSTKKAGDGFTVFKGVITNLVTDALRKLIDGLKEAARYALNTGMDFEAGMSQVAAVSGASSEDMDRLTKKAMEMGASTKFSATQSAEAFNYMAMAGWKTEDMLDGISGIMSLAAAANTDLGTASDIVTDALTAMGYAASDAGRMADVMAAASSNANTNVELMGATFKYVAPVAGALGFSMEDVAIATGLMANSGIKGEMAGTQLRAGLLKLTKPTKEMSELMTEYGISLTNSDGSMKTLMQIMEMYRAKLGGLSEAEQANAAAILFGTEAASGWLSIINSGDADFNKLTAAINNSNGAADQMSSIMMDNLKGDITLLKSALEGVAINGFGSFTDALRTGVQAITGFVSGETDIRAMFDGIHQAAGMAVERIREYVPQIREIAVQLVSNLVGGIVERAPQIGQAAGKLAGDLLSSILSHIPEIIEMGSNIISGLLQGIVSAIPNLIADIPQIVWGIVKTIANLNYAVVDVGVNLIKGLWQGISDTVGWIIDKIKGFTTKVLDAIKGFFGIHSPSTMMRDEVGRYIAEGIGEGIEANAEKAVAPVDGIAQKIRDIDVSKAWDDVKASGQLDYDVNANLGDFVSTSIDTNNQYPELDRLINAVEDLVGRPIELNIDGHRFAMATAGASDSVSGNRLNLMNRGLAL